MRRPLADARAKLRRANQHFNTLHLRVLRRIKRQGEAPPYDVEIETDDNTGYLIARIVDPVRPPVSWSLVVGDIVTNLRAALDYAAWRMVKAGSNPNPKREEEISFPIYSAEEKFRKNLNRRLPCIRSDHLAVVERHQPYHYGMRAQEHPLQRLADLSRIDKHRRLAVVLAAHSQYSGEIKHLSGWTRGPIEVPKKSLSVIETGTELFRIRGRRIPHEELKVEMSFGGAVEIAFEDGTKVMRTLDVIRVAVGMILKELGPLF